MIERTAELLEKSAEAGYFPAAVRAQMTRTLGEDAVRAFTVLASAHLDNGDGMRLQMRAAAITDTRFIHWIWSETTEPDGADDESTPDLAAIAQLFGDMPGVPGPAELVMTTRTVPLTQVVDVQTDVRFTAGPGPVTPRSVQVMVMSGTLNALQFEPASCGELECGADHGYSGRAIQDAISFTLTDQSASTQALDDLLDFAAAAENALHR